MMETLGISLFTFKNIKKTKLHSTCIIILSLGIQHSEIIATVHYEIINAVSLVTICHHAKLF